jgi:hypothetical protein
LLSETETGVSERAEEGGRERGTNGRREGGKEYARRAAQTDRIATGCHGNTEHAHCVSACSLAPRGGGDPRNFPVSTPALSENKLSACRSSERILKNADHGGGTSAETKSTRARAGVGPGEPACSCLPSPKALRCYVRLCARPCRKAQPTR